MSDPIQREVARGRNIGDKEEEENPKPRINNQTQNRDQDPRNQDLKEKIINKDTNNFLGVTNSTSTTNIGVHDELKVENNVKEELSSKVRRTEETVNKESNIFFPHLIPFYMEAQNNKTLPHQISMSHEPFLYSTYVFHEFSAQLTLLPSQSNLRESKIQQPKIQSFDPNNKINQPNLLLDLLSKLKKLKINYNKLADEIIKMCLVKSKDQLADQSFC